MRKIRALAFFMFTFAILLCVAILPILFSYFQDTRLLGKVYTTKTNKSNSMKNASLSTEDRIALIYKYASNSKSIAMVAKKPALHSTLSNLPDIAIKEVKKLQQIGILSRFKIDNSLKVLSFYLNSYTDMNSPGAFVQVGYIYFSCGDNTFYITLDAETHLIYEFVFLSHYSLLNNNFKTILPKEYSKYLNVKWEKINSYYEYEDKMSKIGKVKSFYQYLKFNTTRMLSPYENITRK